MVYDQNFTIEDTRTHTLIVSNGNGIRNLSSAPDETCEKDVGKVH